MLVDSSNKEDNITKPIMTVTIICLSVFELTRVDM